MVVEKEKHIMMAKEKTPAQEIHVSHVTIRQSISFLLLRLILLEVVSILGLILSLLFFFNPGVQNQLGGWILYVNIPYFVGIVLLKTFVMLFIILQWLEEYYEINPKYVIHKKGFIFRKEEKYLLTHLGKVKLEQGVLGRIFNYGNVKIFNWALEKDVTLYLIHNPTKAMRILEELLPESDEEKETIREHLIDRDVES